MLLIAGLGIGTAFTNCINNGGGGDFKIDHVNIADHPVIANYTTVFSLQMQDSLGDGLYVHWELEKEDGHTMDTLTASSKIFWTAPGEPGQYSHRVWVESIESEVLSKKFKFTLDVVEWVPQLTPKKIVFSAAGSNGQYQIYTMNIYTMNADGTNLRQLTDWERGAVQPSWSPDGNRIVFASFRNSMTVTFLALWIMNADGTGAHLVDEREESRLPLLGTNPAWSPDGSKIAYELCPGCEGGGNPDIYIYDLEKGEEIQLTDHLADDTNPSWSPDGYRIVFNSGRDYRDNPNMSYGRDLYIMNVDGSGKERISYNGNTRSPKFSPDGLTIAFRDFEEYGTLRFLDLKTKSDYIAYTYPREEVALFLNSWSVNGKKFLFGLRDFNYPGVYDFYVFDRETNVSDSIYSVSNINSSLAVQGADWN